jgi:hypothetical protein
MCSWSAIVCAENIHPDTIVHVVSSDRAACRVLVTEVYMRGIVSASGIRFFSEGDQNLSGEHTHESCWSRGDLGEGGAEALFLECV